jgi:hypothetical protein
LDRAFFLRGTSRTARAITLPRDDIEQLDAALLLYDASYRWCRDATAESHNWPSGKIAA